MASPTVAVIVPLLNEVATLPALLANIAKIDPDETIFVDGGSDDGSCGYLERSGLCCLPAERGRARQMNRGAASTTADILLFLHADTRLPAGALAAVREALADPAVLGGRFDVTIEGVHPLFRLIERLVNLRSRVTGIMTGDQVIFVRRAAFERLGGFPNQPLMEDVEFSRRLKHAGRIVCLRDKVTTSGRRWQRHGIVRTVLLMWRLRLLYWCGADPERLVKLYRAYR